MARPEVRSARPAARQRLVHSVGGLHERCQPPRVPRERGRRRDALAWRTHRALVCGIRAAAGDGRSSNEPGRTRVQAAAARRDSARGLARTTASHPGGRPERPPRRVLARCRPEPVVRRHRRGLGARAVLAGRGHPAGVAAGRCAPEVPHRAIRRSHRHPSAWRRVVRAVSRGRRLQALRHVGDPPRQQGARAVSRSHRRPARVRGRHQESARPARRPRPDARSTTGAAVAGSRV
jgi:hypothetical protein